MTVDELATILRYHECTKHHPQRFAASPGFLDWANQPDPFRVFEGAPRCELPLLEHRATPGLHALDSHVDAAELDLAALGRFLELALGITAWKEHGGARWALRANPSSGNLHPTEGYAILPPLEGLDERAGLYHYLPREHALERRCGFGRAAWEELMAGLPAGSFLVGLSSIHWREAWKYGERAFRYCQHDLGHALATLSYAARCQGWTLRLLPGPGDGEVAAVLGLDRAGDFASAEREHPAALAVVAPAASPPAPEALAAWSPELPLFHESRWSGRANRLSAAVREWPLIEQAARAAIKPRGAAVATGEWGAAPAHPSVSESGQGPPVGAAEIIRQRRSAVAFDRRAHLSSERFFALLARLRPRPGIAPFEALCWEPALALVLFVHRVEGLAPGLYLLGGERLGAALGGRFAPKPLAGTPSDLPLALLEEGGCEDRARALSCHQDIAADCVFSLAMVVTCRERLERFGPWFYRRLFWEAGLLGQVVYLEAEEAGLRATGIGCFFDDQVHRLLGLRGDGHQSLYHFAIGAPIEDARLSTLPAYPPARRREVL